MVTTNLYEQKEVPASRPNYNKGQYDELREFLDVDWDSLLSLYKNDVETMWNIVKEKILEGVNKYVPSSLPFSSWKKAKWKRPISVNTRKIIKQKVNFGNATFKVETQIYCFLIKKKFVILSETKQDR